MKSKCSEYEMALHVDTFPFRISAPEPKMYTCGERTDILLKQNHFNSLAR